MTVIFKNLIELSTNELAIYSVILGSKSITEFEEFVAKKFPSHVSEMNELDAFFNRLYSRKQIHDRWFKPEGAARAVPYVNEGIKEKNKNDLGLRLYCKPLKNNTLILFNGDIKTHNDPMQCKNVDNHFNRAVKISRLLDKAISDGFIDMNDKNPFSEYEFDI